MTIADNQDSATAAAPDVQPLEATGGRLASLDFIRGIAVMGILAANIVAFGQPFAAYIYPAAFTVPHTRAEDWMWVAQFVLVDGKMRGLFTLLFGAGMALFMDRAWARGATRWLQVRRLFWLLLFGLAHFYLLWRGDILVFYALAGFVALGAVRWTAKSQMTAGVLAYAVGAVLIGTQMTMPWLVTQTSLGDRPQYAETRVELHEGKNRDLSHNADETAIIRTGSYADFVRHNVSAHRAEPFSTFLLFALETLPLMLIGMAFYRIGVFDGRADPAVLRKWGWIGVIGGTVLTVPIALWALRDGLTYYGTLAAFMGLSPLPRLPVVLGLATLLSLWGLRARGWLAERVTAAGRVALSNYLGTSMAMVLLFHGWAGGLFGALGRSELYLVVLLSWITMLAWSKPWLARFRFGPLEWLWRCLTYWRVFPIRR